MTFYDSFSENWQYFSVQLFLQSYLAVLHDDNKQSEKIQALLGPEVLPRIRKSLQHKYFYDLKIQLLEALRNQLSKRSYPVNDRSLLANAVVNRIAANQATGEDYRVAAASILEGSQDTMDTFSDTTEMWFFLHMMASTMYALEH